MSFEITSGNKTHSCTLLTSTQIVRLYFFLLQFLDTARLEPLLLWPMGPIAATATAGLPRTQHALCQLEEFNCQTHYHVAAMPVVP